MCRNPQAEILKSEAIKNSAAPVVAEFSSRGPNSLVPEILKVYMMLKSTTLSRLSFVMH